MSDNNLIPMINVVFLLLVFFMVAGIVRISDPLPLRPPESAGDNPVIAQTVLYVTANGTLTLDNTSVSMASLKATLTKLRATQTTAVMTLDFARQEPEDTTIRETQSKPSLAIKADAQVTVSLLRDVMHAVTTAGLPRVELITSWVPSGNR